MLAAISAHGHAIVDRLVERRVDTPHSVSCTSKLAWLGRSNADGLNDLNMVRTFGFAIDGIYTYIYAKLSIPLPVLLKFYFYLSHTLAHWPWHHRNTLVCKFTVQNYTLAGDSSGCLPGHASPALSLLL